MSMEFKFISVVKIFIVSVFFLKCGVVFSATRYWVGGTGTWNSSNTTNWSVTSGGAGGASVPTSADDVFFDANSFSGAGQTVTISATVDCLSMTWTGVTNTPTLAGSSTLNIFGNLTFASGMTITYTGTIEFESSSTGKTITTAGKSLLSNLYFKGAGGGWTMQDALTTSKELQLTAGTFSTNNFAISVRQLNCYGFSSTTRQINLGSSTVTITPGTIYTTDILNFDGSNLTVNAGTSSISINLSSSATFEYEIDYNGKSLYDLTLSAANTGVLTTGSASFHNLTIGSGVLYELYVGTTHAITNTFSVNGSCTSFIFLRSSTPGTLATISCTGGPQTSSNVIVKDVTFSSNTNTCTDCVDLVATDGTWSWTTPRSSRNLYWIGQTGNYSDVTQWSTTSGGTNDVTCSPTPIDNVYFDANSFNAGSQTVTIDRMYIYCKNMDWTGVANTPTFSGSFVNILIAGTLTYSSSMNLSNYVSHYFQSSTNPTPIKTNGKGLYYTYFQAGGYYTLQTNIDINGSINISSGTTLDVLANGGVAGIDEKNINFTNSWVNYGTFVERSNNSAWVIYDGSSTSYLYANEIFNNFEVNGTGTFKTNSYAPTFTNKLLITTGILEHNPSSAKTATCSNLCQIDGGKIYLSTSNANMTLANDLDVNGGTFQMLLGTTTVTGNIDSGGGKIQMDGGTLTINGNNVIDGGSLTNSGELEINGTATVTIGNGTSEDLVIEGGLLDMNSGTLNVKGYLDLTAGTFDIAGGTINLSTAVTSGTPFSLTGGTYTLTGGTVDIKNVDSGGAANCINVGVGTTLSTISGGTVKISATNANSLINVNSTRKLYSLEVATTGRTITLSDALDLDGSFTLTNGVLNTSGLTMYVGGTWTYTAGTFTHSNNTVTFDGASNQSIAGATSTSFYNLTNSNTSTGITLNQNITVSNTLSMAGVTANIDLNSYTIDLSSTGSISGESNTDRIYGATGTITTTRDIGAPTSLNVGNMGCVLTSATNMGSTTIIRGHTPQIGVHLNTGISRYFSISPTTNTGLNATLDFYYFDNEIVGHNEADLALYRSTVGGSTWTFRGGTVMAASNYISLSSIDAFSIWTLSDPVASPLPVNLISFKGFKSNNFNNLIWKTTSERNNSHFILEKSEDGITFNQISSIVGAGTTLIPVNYNYVDYNIIPVVNYYRLSQFDYDGKKETFKKIVSIDNRSYGDKKIVARYNVLGQFVNEDYKGVVILLFSDGTSEKILQ